jgi:hypothetical protein
MALICHFIKESGEGLQPWLDSFDIYPSNLLLSDFPSRCLQCSGTATLKDQPFVGGPGAVDVFSAAFGDENEGENQI